jgi:hypothetical protein
MTITDLTPTQKANSKQNRYGESLDEAHARIRREIPSTVDACMWLVNGPNRLSDEGLFRLIGDLGNVGNTISRRGHRTPPTPEQITETAREIFVDGLGVGQGPYIEAEYTSQSFMDAFRQLVGGRSMLQMSRRTGIQITRMKRIKSGAHAPTGDEMALIAETFGKQPWYFREVRSVMVAAMVLARMDANPDTSARIVRALAS